MSGNCGTCGSWRSLRQIVPAEDRSGAPLYMLATFPDGTVGHTGEFVGRGIFVACPGDVVNERLFAWDDYQAAADYVTEQHCQLDKVPTTSLCDAAVRSVYSPGS